MRNSTGSTGSTQLKRSTRRYRAVKFSGSLALMLTVVGILMAVGGQLDFLGNDRSASPVAQPVHDPKMALKNNEKKPKYSFYNALEKRKTEIEHRRKNDNAPLVTSPPTTPATTTTENSHQYVVQVGAFRRKNDADKVKKKVEDLGFSARIVDGSNKYLTQAGPFGNRTQAKSAERRLRRHKLDTLIKRLK